VTSLRSLWADDVSSHDNILAAREQFAEELLRGYLVPATLHQDVEDVAVLIHSTPQIVRLPADFEKYLIQVSCIAGMRTSPAQLVRVGLSESETPLNN